MNRKQLARLHTNQRLLVSELLRRGVEVDVLVEELELLEACYNGRVEFLLDRDSTVCPYPGSVICSNKYLTKKLLIRAGLRVPRGEQFYADQWTDALRYAESLAFPVVLKPSIGSHGHCCFPDLYDKGDLEQALDWFTAAYGVEGAFLIEEQMPGAEFRIFYTRHGDYAVLHRDPAHVVGDGVNCIRELAERESHQRMHPRKNCLCPIVVDRAVEKFLARSDLTLESVPAVGQKIYLRRNSNIAQGGVCEDYTDRVHPSVIEIARDALRAVHGLAYVGVDILSTDITCEQTAEYYSVLELNSNPGVHMHVRPAIGKSQPVQKFLADIIFPETRMPKIKERECLQQAA